MATLTKDIYYRHLNYFTQMQMAFKAHYCIGALLKHNFKKIQLF
jgi:hypothetical protein